MTIVVNHSTLADGTFSATGATAWDANHTLSGVLPVANGGTSFSTYAIGDIIYSSAINTLSKLSVGSASQVLTVAGGVPTWAAVPSSMVYPGAGIANSTGSAWGTSYSVSGTGSVALTSNPVFATDVTVNTLRVGLGAGNLSSNVAMGNQALNANTTGANNVAIGSQSLLTSSTAINNVAIGGNTLRLTTIGQDNIAIGYNALAINVGGNANTAIGSGALIANTSGIRNTGIGQGALVANSSGSNNVGIGRDSGVAITTGGDNVCIGNTSAATLTTGSNNTIIGRSANVAAAANTNSIVIGQGATGLGTNTTVIGNSSTTQTKVFGAIQSTTYTVATLPSASTVGVGARAFVTDATTPVFGMAVVGSGSVPVPVYSTGSAWNVG